MRIDRLEIPLAKAEYLFSHSTAPGEGGDKQKFWCEILGFDSAEAVREAILAQVTPDNLEKTTPNAYGERYQSIIEITGHPAESDTSKPFGQFLAGEKIARLVTAVPQSIRR